jgi:uncharacterized protein YpbB
MEMTDLIAVASRFVNSTRSHIFLTGKAGTGKTTFLHNLAASTHKKHVIVAPTGIAALNAKGVTIHSQFLLPLGTFIPEREAPLDLGMQSNFYAQRTLAAKHPLNKIRRQVLRNIDLVIIDEVSMLRADVLDAIDYRMRSVRNNFQQSFGGVQVLMIGDLYQLPPVVKDAERACMNRYYRSPHFFEAKALQQDGFVFIELDKIFRQKSDKFIGLLNNLRNNTVTKEDVILLNERFMPEMEGDKEEIITITTHNYRAEELNQKALAKLATPSFFFNAQLEGEFPESAYPVLLTIELKVGAQIMFVKNDTSGGVYFNGKLATVESIDDDSVMVRLAGSGIRFSLRKEVWENKRYTTNEKSKELEEEVIGTFSQYPIRLAWAITVHKSQGLTFDRAIIDVGQAFAPGQVYVALSRLTSLEGLILRTQISPNVVSTDNEVVEFSKRKDTQGELIPILRQQQAAFVNSLLETTFQFQDLVKELEQIQQKHQVVHEFDNAEMRNALPSLVKQMIAESETTARFRQQLAFLLQSNDDAKLSERLIKGTDYFEEKVKVWVKELLLHIAEVSQLSKIKTYHSALEELDLMLMKKWEDLQKSESMARCILSGADISISPEFDRKRKRFRETLLEEVTQKVAANPKNSARKTGRIRKAKDVSAAKAPKAEKGDTYRETHELLKEGLTIAQVAERRGLQATTIESHVARCIADGKVDIGSFLTPKQLNTVSTAIKTSNEASVKAVFDELKGKFSFGQIRMVLASFARKKLEE